MSKSKYLKIAWSTVGILALIVLIMGYIILRKLYTGNVASLPANKGYLFIPSGSDFDDVVEILEDENLLINKESFLWTSKQMKYDENIKPGRYLLKPGMNNKELITLLRSGRQTPVMVTFNNIRTKEQLAFRIGEQLETKPQAIINLLSDNDYTSQLGFTPDNILSMFLPDTYEFYWNTSADKFIKRMKKEYDKFWNTSRKTLAAKIDLTPVQVSVLASIVQMESNKEDEKPTIAGVYLNRFKKDWKLEADPTLVYALGDFTITRVLSVYKEIDSPYNTYKYKGLPPGPICLPTSKSINAVLNYVPHKYMYFCARDDFSGYHAFAVSYAQHLLNARKFQKALDRKGIRS
jgi:UPF0755 protein